MPSRRPPSSAPLRYTSHAGPSGFSAQPGRVTPVRSGTVTPLALVASQRLPLLSDPATQAEAGIAGPVMPG
jgi:tripartite-type tricarboxylate transporter receptor subunit TctC